MHVNRLSPLSVCTTVQKLSHIDKTTKDALVSTLQAASSLTSSDMKRTILIEMSHDEPSTSLPTSTLLHLPSERPEFADQTASTEVGDCSICLEPLIHEVIKTKKCGHIFHRRPGEECYSRCPICREQLMPLPQYQPVEASELSSRLRAYITEMRRSIYRYHHRNRSMEEIRQQPSSAIIAEGELNHRCQRTRQRAQVAGPDALPFDE